MVEVDTSKVEICGTNIIKLSEDLGVIFKDLFDDLSKLMANNVWSGTAAMEFIAKTSIEKNFYVDFQKNLYNYGNVLKNNANSFDKTIKEIDL